MNVPIIAYRANMGVQTTAPFINAYSTLFDGTDDYVDCGVPSNINSLPNISISCWFKTTTTATSYIVGSDSQSSGRRFLLSTVNSSGIKIRFLYFTNPATASFNLILSTTNVNDGNWHHVLAVNNGTDMFLYLDGILENSNTDGGINAAQPNTPLNIGRRSYLGSYGNFAGNVDEVAIWGTDQSANIATLSTAPTVDLTDLNPIAWYRNGDNGSWKSPQWLIPNNENKDKVSNYSLSFDGMDDYVDIGNGINFDYTDAFSISTWVKPLAESGVKYLYSKYTGGRGILIYFNSASGAGSNTIYFNLYNTNSGSTATRKRITTNTGAIVLPSVWTNLVITYDGSGLGTGINVYKNGASQTVTVTQDNSQNNTIVVAQNAYISGNNFASSFFPGNQDEFAIYSTELLQDDVDSVYNSGEPTTISGAIAHYKMGEEANFTSNWLVDNSALNNYSTRSFEFDGVDDRVSLASSVNLGINSTISLWVKLDSGFDCSMIGESSYGSNYLLYAKENISFYVRIGGVPVLFPLMVTQIPKLTSGAWHNIAIQRSGDSIEVFLDGASKETKTGFGTSVDTLFDTFGSGSTGGSPTEGLIDEIVGWNNNTVNPVDIYNGGIPTTITGAVAHYKMGEDASFNGTNWTVPDNAGTNNGTSANMDVNDLVGEAPNYSGGGISANMNIFDRVGEAPNSTNNALSLNMDEVDRTTDVPN